MLEVLEQYYRVECCQGGRSKRMGQIQLDGAERQLQTNKSVGLANG